VPLSDSSRPEPSPQALSGPFPPSNGFNPDQVAQVVSLLQSGASFSSIAARLKTTHQRISRIADRFGFSAASVRRAAVANALDAAMDFNAVRRKQAVNLLVERVLEQLEGGEASARGLRDLSVALGVAVDKRRLEEGRSTANEERHVKVWGSRELPSGNTGLDALPPGDS
jgi:hypothetical protein